MRWSMKKRVLTIILLVTLVLLLAGATVWYKALSSEYSANGITIAGESSIQPDRQAEQAPDFTVLDMEGEEISLSQLLGKPVIINFWATWCGPCNTELPDFDKFYSEYGDSVEFLMVNLTDGSRDTIETVKEFIENAGYSFPVYFDTELEAANAYGVYSIPRTVAINPDGTINMEQTGLMSEKQLRTCLENLTTEKEK